MLNGTTSGVKSDAFSCVRSLTSVLVALLGNSPATFFNRLISHRHSVDEEPLFSEVITLLSFDVERQCPFSKLLVFRTELLKRLFDHCCLLISSTT